MADKGVNVNVQRMMETYLRFALDARDSFSKEELYSLFQEIKSSVGGSSDAASHECAKMMCFITLGQAAFGQAMREALGEKDTSLDTVRALVALCEQPPQF